LRNDQIPRCHSSARIASLSHEQSFRYNNRLEMNDADRFNKLLKKVTGKRVTYSKLTGKEDETTVF
jgi:hypothetical protein